MGNKSILTLVQVDLGLWDGECSLIPISYLLFYKARRLYDFQTSIGLKSFG